MISRGSWDVFLRLAVRISKVVCCSATSWIGGPGSPKGSFCACCGSLSLAVLRLDCSILPNFSLVFVDDLDTESMVKRTLGPSPRPAPVDLASQACCILEKLEASRLGCCICCTYRSSAWDCLAPAGLGLSAACDRQSCLWKAMDHWHYPSQY